MGDGVGVIYGTASSTRFDVALSDPRLRRLDYVAVEAEGHRVLGQVDDVVRKSGLSFDDALEVDDEQLEDDKLSAAVEVVGYLDEEGRVQAPRTPFAAGQAVERADDGLVRAVLGLEPGADGALLGQVKGSRIPVRLSMNMLAQKHVSVLAKTGAGKSYTVGVLLEEFIAAGVPLVILDPHGEYGSLRHANVEPADIERMAGQGLKPRSFRKQVQEFALDTDLNPDADRLRVEGINLEGREIVDLLGGKLSGGQVGVLYQAVKEVKDHMPGYTLQDIMDQVQQNRSSAKWNVLNALEALEGTGVFQIKGTPVKDLVQPRKTTIINLKGVAPDVQEVAVTRLTGVLWEARKRGDVPPFILVCEEAHNFCPERGVGNAVSGPVIRTVASEGRKFGMGLVIVSQRPAKIDKNVLSQCNTQLVLKVTNPNDLKAIVSSVEGITSKAGDEVQRLAIGTALVAGGGLTQPVFVDIRPRLTSHGGRSVDVVGATTGSAPLRRPKLPELPGEQPKDEKTAPIRNDASNREPLRIIQEAARVAAATQEIEQRGAHGRAPEPAARDLPIPLSAEHRVAPPQDHPAAPPHKPSAHAPHVPTPPGERQMTTVMEAPSEAAEAERPAKTSRHDADVVHRVASRLGIVDERRDADDTVRFIRELAKQGGHNPGMRIGLYAEIGQKACHDDAPQCIRCPLAQRCRYHQRARSERKKTRAGIRRLWHR